MPDKTILCPTDFSDPSDHALLAGIELAQALGARVRVVHCYGLPTYFALPELALIPSEEYAFKVSTAHQEKLDALMARHRDGGVPMQAVLRVGAPADEIIAEADACDASMVVVGSRGHGSVSKMLLGSVTERVLRRSTRPVLVVPD